MPPTVARIPRFELNAEVVAHAHIFGNEYEIVFHAPPIAAHAQPGQFLELLFGDNYAPLLRRPFALYRVDREAGTFSVLYLARGAFTTGLSQQRPGDRVNVLGPLGAPFCRAEGAGMRHVLIAGGIGAPPLYFLARELTQDLLARGDTESSVTVINAARTRDLLIGMGEFENLRLRLLAMTDDGSHGRQGRAPDLLASLLAEMQADAAPIQLYACGPMVMLRALAEFALARSLPCQVSVETSMPCGIGLCMGCAIPVRDSASAAGFAYARACVEGPVFEAAELLWE